MASSQANAINELYREWLTAMAGNPDMDLETTRDLFDHWGDLTRDPAAVDYVEIDAAGVSAMWAIPKGCADDRIALCTHGGGYVVGSMYTHRKLFGHIAKAVGCKALILDYRRAPEYTHPAQVDDAVAAYRWLLDEGYKSEYIFTTGDSAGGGLATSVLLGIRSAGLPLPAGAIPMSPWYDPEATGATLTSNADKDSLVNAQVLQGMATTFLGDASAQDPLANLLYADLKGLPPIYIQVGSYEALLDDSIRFETKAREAGIDIRVDVFPEMQHVFQLMAGRAPEADDAIAKMAQWIKPKLGL